MTSVHVEDMMPYYLSMFHFHICLTYFDGICYWRFVSGAVRQI